MVFPCNGVASLPLGVLVAFLHYRCVSSNEGILSVGGCVLATGNMLP